MRLSLLTFLVTVVQAGYAAFLADNQEDLLPFAHDDHRIRNNLLQRRLQFDNKTVAQPDEVCTSYNEALAGIMTCSCGRFGATDVKIFCTDVAETCVPDGSSCVLRTIETVITSDSLSRVTTSCTNSTTVADLNTCVQIFPIEPGNYEGIEKCSATLNGELCSSCSECVFRRDATANTTAATVNCCNVKEDAVQFCGAIGPLGGFVSFYDPVPAGGEGTCPSGAEQSRVWVGLLIAALGSLWTAMR